MISGSTLAQTNQNRHLFDEGLCGAPLDRERARKHALDASKPLLCNFSRIHWNRTVAEHYGARVVQPKTVIGVRVCKKDGRKVLESDPESLA